MADKKISELTALTGADTANDDQLVIVDTSAGLTKNITMSEFKNALDTATGFVRITGDTMTGNLSMGDNVKAIFGAGSDLQIYHDGSHSYIKDNGTGNLLIQGSAAIVLEDPDGNNMIYAEDGGPVYLYSNGSQKLATTSTGINVTGTITSDGLTVDGTTNLQGTNPDLYFIESDTTNLNTYIANGSGNFTTYTANDAKNSFKQRINLNHATGDISFYEDTGTTPKLTWSASTESLRFDNATLQEINGTDPFLSGNAYYDGSAWKYATTSNATNYYQTNRQHIWRSAGTGTAGNNITWSESMRIDSSGNVGIGTDSPNNYSANHKSITLNAPTTPLIDLEVNGTRTGSFVADTTKVDLNAVTSVPLRFLTADTERMRIDSSGNVGIGVVPARQVHMHNASGDNNFHITNSTTGSTAADGFSIVSQSTTNDVLFNQRETANMRFFTANDEKMRIDSSGNLLVGVASSSANMAGVEIAANGQLYASTSSSSGHFFNISHGNDGDIVSLRKDGSTVGSISSRGGVATNLILRTATGQGAGIGGANSGVLPCDEDGLQDDEINLGASGTRWKDLYLSGRLTNDGTGGVAVDSGGDVEIIQEGTGRLKAVGGIFIGDTASGNHLDDYEEGTWTPSFSATGLSGVTIGGGTAGYYTKVGNKVTAWFTIYTTGTFTKGSAALFIAGLPYTSANNTGGQGAISFHNATRFDASPPIAARVDSNSTSIKLYSSINATGAGTDPVSVSSSNMRSAAAENCNFVSGTVTYMV